MIKKLTSIIVVLSLILGAIIFLNIKNKEDLCEIIVNSVYFTNNDNSIKEARNIKIKTYNCERLADIDTLSGKGLIIINYDEINNNQIYARLLTDAISTGKICLIRTDKDIDRNDISKLLNYDNSSGIFIEDAIENNIITFGYLTYIDKRGNIQMIRQKFVDLDYTETISYDKENYKQNNNKYRDKKSGFKANLYDELDAINGLLPAILERENNIKIMIIDNHSNKELTLATRDCDYIHNLAINSIEYYRY